MPKPPFPPGQVKKKDKPVLDWNLESTWDSAYSSYIGQYEIIGYWRHFQRPEAVRKVDALVARLSITETTTIVIVGGGYGYLREEFLTLFPTMTIVTTDISDWIHANKDNTETADLEDMIAGLGLDHTIPGSDGERILTFMDTGLTRSIGTVLDEDSSNGGSRNRIRSEAGLANNVDFDLIISDDVLTVLSDIEAQDFSTDLNALGTFVVHLVMPGDEDGADQVGGAKEDLDYNWHTLAEWKVLLPSDGIFSVTDFEAAV